MNSNCIIGSHIPVLRNKVALITERAMGEVLASRLHRINSKLSIEKYQDYEVLSDDWSGADLLDTNADIIIYTPYWESIVHKLKKSGVQNAYLYFKFGDPMIHPAVDKRQVPIKAFFWLLMKGQ